LRNGRARDTAAAITFWVIPIAAGALALAWGWKLAAPSALLTGVALLMGGLLSTAGVLSTLRLKLTDRSESHSDAIESERNLDEAVPHVLTAALASLVAAVLLVIGMNVPSDAPSPALGTGWTAPIVTVLTFIALLFVATIIRLYAAYVQVNRVSRDLNGFVRPGRL